MKFEVQLISRHPGHKDAVYTLTPAAQLDSFYSAGADGFVVLWQPHLQADGIAVLKADSPVYALLHIKHLNLLAVGTNNGGLYFVDTLTNKVIKSVQVQKDAIFDILYLPAVKSLLCASRDGSIATWSLSDLTCLATLQISPKGLRRMAVNSSASRLAVAGSDGKIRIYDLPHFKLITSIDAHSNSIFCLNFAVNDSAIISGGRDAMLKSWNAETGKLYNEVPAHYYTINDMVMHPQGNIFATGAMDKTIKIWHAETLSLLKIIDRTRYEAHTHGVNRLLWLNETTLVSAAEDKQVLVWQVQPL